MPMRNLGDLQLNTHMISYFEQKRILLKFSCAPKDIGYITDCRKNGRKVQECGETDSSLPLHP